MKTPLPITHFVVALALFTVGSQAHASQWYHVELIVFEQLSTVTDEQWPRMNGLPTAPLTPNTANDLIQPAETSTLSDIAKKLQRSAHYRVHYYRAWQQLLLSKHRAQAVKIQSDNNLIDGNILLYKSTYLHANLNLWLKQKLAQSTSGSDSAIEGGGFNAPRNPNLKQGQRISSSEITFFDHPKLGAIVKLTPIKTAAATQN